MRVVAISVRFDGRFAFPTQVIWDKGEIAFDGFFPRDLLSRVSGYSADDSSKAAMGPIVGIVERLIVDDRVVKAIVFLLKRVVCLIARRTVAPESFAIVIFDDTLVFSEN